MPKIVNSAINKKRNTKGSEPNEGSIIRKITIRCSNYCLCGNKRWLVYVFSFISTVVLGGGIGFGLFMAYAVAIGHN